MKPPPSAAANGLSWGFLRVAALGLLATAAAMTAGCAPKPIATGEIVLVVLGDKPVPRSNETGSWGFETFSTGRIAIYESCIVVTEPNGTKHYAPPDRFSVVRFK